MVDALLNAAHSSDDSEYQEDEVDDVPQQITHSHVRTCEFCGSSNTPTWRRGPGGKGSLCNACGIKWRLRKRTKKGDQSPTEKKVKKSSPPTKRRKRVKDDEDSDIPSPALKRSSPSSSLPDKGDYSNEDDADMNPNNKNYYCKYCNKTWDITYFKNSQQFGAHCSNCSRKPRQDGSVPQSPAYYKDAGPANLIMILRYLQDELSDLEDEENVTPSSPSSPPSLPSQTVPQLSPLQLPSFAQLQLPLPNLSMLRNNAPPSYDPLNTLRLAANAVG